MNVRQSLYALIFTLLLSSPSLAQTLYTPSEFKVTLYSVAVSMDGVRFVEVFDDPAGLQVDIADPTSFTSAFGDSVNVPAGTYRWIRMTIDADLFWSAGAPVNRTDELFTVSGGPPGPAPGQMSVYFATDDQGGTPNGQGGGEGTLASPFLLGAAARIGAGTATTMRLIFVVTDALKELSPGVYDLAPPQMFFVTENGDSSTLSGSYNTVIYNAVKEFIESSPGVFTPTKWMYVSGHGILAFDGAGGWTWAGTTNTFDLLGGATTTMNSSAVHSGKYGLNEDGSFWLLTTGEPGTLTGAVSADDRMIVAGMYDSPSSHMMVFGVEQATSGATSDFSGDFYFTTYGNRWNSGSTTLKYEGSFGTVTGDGLGGITGAEDDNEVSVANPTGSPVITGPITSSGPITDSLSVTSAGVMSNVGGSIGGGMLEGGDAGCIAFGFDGSAENEFGFMVEQSPSGTFTDASLVGEYFGGHCGDVLDSGVSKYFSGFFRASFDGRGNATVQVLENREGVIEINTFLQDYSVDLTTGFVTFTDPGGGSPSDMFGAIGPGATSFLLASEPVAGPRRMTSAFSGWD